MLKERERENECSTTTRGCDNKWRKKVTRIKRHSQQNGKKKEKLIVCKKTKQVLKM